MIKKLEIYDLEHIHRGAHIEASCFVDLKKEADGLRSVRTFRDRCQSNFPILDRRWIALCQGDEHELTEWATRMQMVQQRLNELDRQLASAHIPHLFEWEKVAACMGFINVFRVAAEQTLDYNEHIRKKAA